MNDTALLALQDAEATGRGALVLVDETLKRVGNKIVGISIAPRQADELAKFIRAHGDELKHYCEEVRKSDTSLNVQLLMTRRMELEEALRFVQRVFIQPRSMGSEIQALEAADWLCVDGFQLFVHENTDSPVGPLVAIESSQSPAVWAPDAALPIPSLFQTQPKMVARAGVSARTLPPFPLVCLPGHLAHSPEYYPLLSHEVGHAVDNAAHISAQIVEDLPAVLQTNYWRKWMREIFADAVGVMLSGEAFLLALARYLDTLPPFEEVSASNSYPGNTLRRAMIGACLNHLIKTHGSDTTLSVVDLIPKDADRRFGRTARALLIEFREQVLPVIARHTFGGNKEWPGEHLSVSDLAAKVASGDSLTWPSGQPFRLMPSVIALAQQANPSLNTYAMFREMHKSITKHPPWVEGPTKWVFSEEYLPSLRPTLLGADGKFKVPPVLLLATHQKIAFVGATNWQLAKSMEQAFMARGEKPWEEIHLFFATDDLLRQVEYGEKDSQKERDQSEAEFLEILHKGHWAKRWTIYRFNGPPVFASYWDWDTRGGRIHVSPALLGTVIGECPASDHIWQQDTPTDHYRKYVKHLEELLRPIPGTRIVMSS